MWDSLKNTRIPVDVVMVSVGILLGAAWGVFGWADNIEDQQIELKTKLENTDKKIEDLTTLIEGNYGKVHAQIERVDSQVSDIRTRLNTMATHTHE